MAVTDNVIFEFDRLDNSKHKKLINALESQRLTFQPYSLSNLTGYQNTLREEACLPFLCQDGAWRASRWVGTLRVDQEQWAIQPRIGEKQFNLVAGSVLSAAVVRGASRNLGASAHKLDLLPLVWSIAFGNARQRHGLPRAYVRREAQDCTELRGELDLERQLVDNQLARKQYLACRWDDLTLDNPINQGTRIVVDHLRHHRRFPFNNPEDTALPREMNHWRERLPLLGVAKPAHFPTGRGIRWSRGNDGYRVPHQLADWLVKNLGQITGHASAPSILIDSAEVWELYLRGRLDKVVTALSSNWRLDWPRSGAMDYLLDWQGRKVRGLIPDFRIIENNDNRVIAVLDAKYRWYRPPSEDVEIATQMALYTATAGSCTDSVGRGSASLPISILLFPRSKGFNDKVATQSNSAYLLGCGTFQLSGNPQLFAWCIDLPCDKEEAQFHEAVDQQLKTALQETLEAFLKA